MFLQPAPPLLSPAPPAAQVKQWNVDELRGFWQQWYFPANATLYVVGEVGRPTAEVRELIADTFGRVPPGRHLAEGSGHHPPSLNGSSSNGNGAAPHLQQQQGPLKMRHPVCSCDRTGSCRHHLFSQPAAALA